ncbi:MAG: type II toxin-antitoxin system HicA family toxin [Candidatus Latescibacteria bacterium]|nr:type II toxin-antitoxin system HicA family toxin [Candidatus Latescibacterota bacterium]
MRRLGFAGPIAGTRHQLMVHQQHRLAVPSNQEYSVPQFRMMIREVEQILGRQVLAEEWNSLS